LQIARNDVKKRTLVGYWATNYAII